MFIFTTSSVFHAVVYTDCNKNHIAVALNAESDYGMWFPVLAVELEVGSWWTYCISAAANGWKKGWETHRTRLHLLSSDAAPRADTSESSSPMTAIGNTSAAEALPAIKVDDFGDAARVSSDAARANPSPSLNEMD